MVEIQLGYDYILAMLLFIYIIDYLITINNDISILMNNASLRNISFLCDHERYWRVWGSTEEIEASIQ